MGKRNSRMPLGFVALRADLGSILRRRRKYGRFGKQGAVAADANIAPETLSRIENGKAMPRIETLEALLVALDLGWNQIAIWDENSANSSDINSRRQDRLLDAGRELREARLAAGMSLRELAALSGLSLAQLSRVECGQSGGARVYREDPEDLALPCDERRIELSNAILANLVERCRLSKADTSKACGG